MHVSLAVGKGQLTNRLVLIATKMLANVTSYYSQNSRFAVYSRINSGIVIQA